MCMSSMKEANALAVLMLNDRDTNFQGLLDHSKVTTMKIRVGQVCIRRVKRESYLSSLDATRRLCIKPNRVHTQGNEHTPATAVCEVVVISLSPKDATVDLHCAKNC